MKNVTLHPDIYQLVVKVESNQFRISELINQLLRISAPERSRSAARLFISRHLHSLVEQKLLKVTGDKKNRIFSKTPLFSQANFDIKQPRKKTITPNRKVNSQSSVSAP